MLVVIFTDETKAYEGQLALRRAEDEGAIVVRSSAIVATDSEARVTFKDSDDPGPAVLVGYDLVIDVSRSLGPDKVALIAKVDEDSTTSIDTRMQPLGGVVFRFGISAMREQQRRKEVAALQSDLTQARADASDAESTMENIAGVRATRQRVHQRFEDLEKKSLAERIDGSRDAVEAGLDDFEGVIARASARYTDWDHARERLIRARLDEARAKLRIWTRGSES